MFFSPIRQIEMLVIFHFCRLRFVTRHAVRLVAYHCHFGVCNQLLEDKKNQISRFILFYSFYQYEWMVYNLGISQKSRGLGIVVKRNASRDCLVELICNILYNFFIIKTLSFFFFNLRRTRLVIFLIKCRLIMEKNCAILIQLP